MWFLYLSLAALLEVTGDYCCNRFIKTKVPPYLLLGIMVLTMYGLVVNLPRWNFGRLLGTYVALFFLWSQVVNYFGYGQKPTPATMIGGILITTGGLIVYLGK